jgi:hypothetical protein
VLPRQRSSGIEVTTVEFNTVSIFKCSNNIGFAGSSLLCFKSLTVHFILAARSLIKLSALILSSSSLPVAPVPACDVPPSSKFFLSSRIKLGKRIAMSLWSSQEVSSGGRLVQLRRICGTGTLFHLMMRHCRMQRG